MTKLYAYLSLIAILLTGLLSSCGEDEPEPVTVNFTNTEIGFGADDTEVSVEITFSRTAESDGVLEIGLTSQNLIYGADADFYTSPAAEEGLLSLAYAAGDATVSFNVVAGTMLNIQQDETIELSLTASEGFLIGANTSVTIVFSENFIAPSGIVELDGGGAEFPNQAFLDLSKLTQSTVDKYSWDLGFYSGEDNRVIVNNSAYVMARSLDKTSLSDVTAADTAGFGGSMIVSNYYEPAASAWIDSQTGDLSATAFGEISETDAKVYIIKRDGEGRSWKKVRILATASGYEIEYAAIDAATTQTATITKDDSYNFSFFDLDNGVADVEPQKDSWDLMYGSYAGKADYGYGDLAIGYNDYVVLNRADISAAKISVEDFSFADFGQEDLSSITLISDDISVIGSSWRSLVNYSLVLNESVFYVIQDAGGNAYKLRFTQLTSSEGERGYPEIQFELIK